MSSLHPVHPDFLKAATPSGYLRYKQFLGQQGKIRNSLIFQIGMGISQPVVSKVLRNWPHSVGLLALVWLCCELFDDPLRQATNAVGAAIMNGGRPADVLQMRKDGVV